MKREEESKKCIDDQIRQLKLNTQKAEKFRCDLTSLEGRITSLGSPEENISKLIVEEISFADLRIMIKRMEDTTQKLHEKKKDLVSRSMSVVDFNLDELETRIRKEVLDEVEKA